MRAFFVVPTKFQECMDAPVIQEFNGDTGKWDTVPPDPPVETKTAVAVIDPVEDDDAPPAAKPAVPEWDSEQRRPTNAEARKDPKARIAQQSWDQRDAERRATSLAEENARLKADLDAARKPAAPKEAPKPAAAAPDEFPTFQRWLEAHPDAQGSEDPLRDYNKAHFAHLRGIEQQQEQASRETQVIEQTFTSKATAFSEQFATAVKADPDLPSRINSELLTVRPYSLLTAQDKAAIRALPDPAVRDRVAFMCFLADHWLDSPHATAILEHVSDPKEFQRLATLPPAQVVRSLATFEAGLGAARPGSAPKPKSITAAVPDPIQPVGSSPQQSDDSPAETDSDEEWLRKENARLLRQRRGRG